MMDVGGKKNMYVGSRHTQTGMNQRNYDYLPSFRLSVYMVSLSRLFNRSMTR